MGHFSKDIYQKKAEWAAEKNAKSSEVAQEAGLTEEQTDALEQLCSDRHFLHTHQEELFVCESSEHSTVFDLLDGGIDEYMDRVCLDRVEWSFRQDDLISLPNDYDYADDLDEELSEDDTDKDEHYYEEKEELRVEALSEVYEFIEKVNNDIEQYLRDIDTKYGTDYCPSGATRI